MSDSECVSAEVRELLELVLKEPVESDQSGASTPNEQKVPENSQIPLMEGDKNTDHQQKDVPLVIENIHSDIPPAPEPDLRVIESNALKLIAQYGSDSDSESDEASDNDTESSYEVVAVDDVEQVLQNTITQGNYRVVSSDSEDDSSSSDDSSDVEVISVRNEIINLDDDDLEDPKATPLRVEGEFTIDSLPPIEDLKISVPEDECVVLGKVMSIVEQLVVVDSLPNSRPIDIDSVLFLDKGTKPLGHVFDVLGNISSPMYCVRFNSNQQIKDKGITVGSLVYVAPRTEHTSFVVVSELMKNKGCDASWKNDIEPMNAQDFSDDEEERKARRMRRGRNNSVNESEPGDTATPTVSTPPQNANGQRNYRTPRRRRGNFNRGGQNNDRNYGPLGHQNRNYGPPGRQNQQYGSPAQHSWHNNLPQQQSNWNPQMRNNVQMGYPQSLLLPPPPPPPFNSHQW